MPRLEIVSGRGATVVDAAGRQYLDFVSGIAVNALGHSHPGIARAVARQMKQLAHCSNLFSNRPALELARELADGDRLRPRVLLQLGERRDRDGAQVRARPGGRARTRRAATCSRFAAAFTDAPRSRCPPPGTPRIASRSSRWCRAFASPTSATPLPRGPLLDERVAAVIVEPVQGESGAVPASPEFLRGAARPHVGDRSGSDLRRGADRHGTQRPPARLRTLRRSAPTTLVLSKALGGGLPLGAVLMTADAAQSLAPGMHGCTFGGGPVVTTAGRVVLDRVRRPGFLARVRSRGARCSTRGSTSWWHCTLRSPALVGSVCLRAVDWSPRTRRTIRRRWCAPRASRDCCWYAAASARVRFLPPLTVTPAEIAEARRTPRTRGAPAREVRREASHPIAIRGGEGEMKRQIRQRSARLFRRPRHQHHRSVAQGELRLRGDLLLLRRRSGPGARTASRRARGELGATAVVVEDLRLPFLRDFCFPALRAGRDLRGPLSARHVTRASADRGAPGGVRRSASAPTRSPTAAPARATTRCASS